MDKKDPPDFGKPRYGLARARPQSKVEPPVVISQTQEIAARFSPVNVADSARQTAGIERLQRSVLARIAQLENISSDVYQAMQHLPLGDFIDQEMQIDFYAQSELLGLNAFGKINPILVAQMLNVVLARYQAEDVLPIRSNSKVLEIGSGTGYQTVLLSKLYQDVFALEINKTFYSFLRENLRKFLLANVRLVNRDGMLGLAEAAPYDSIVINFAIDVVPDVLLSQLRIGGNLVALSNIPGNLLVVKRCQVAHWQSELVSL